jgi:transcriptional regulator with XRE-family HTH domain
MTETATAARPAAEAAGKLSAARAAAGQTGGQAGEGKRKSNRGVRGFKPEALVAWRKARGMEQKELAAACVPPMSIGGVSHIERGVRLPSMNTVRRLAVALGIRPEDLIDLPELQQSEPQMLIQLAAEAAARRPSIHAQVAGHTFTLRQPDVQRAIGRAEPGEIRDHFVEVGDRRYPVKQALAIATGLDPSEFTSQHARSVLRRLGLRLGRLSAHPSAYAAVHARTSVPGKHGTLPRVHDSHRPRERAEALRPYQNRWVAVQRDHVLTDGDSFSEVLAWLRQNNTKADAVFLVPANPEELLTGLAN